MYLVWYHNGAPCMTQDTISWMVLVPRIGSLSRFRDGVDHLFVAALVASGVRGTTAGYPDRCIIIPFHVDVLETVSLGQRTPPARPPRQRRALRPAHGARHAIAGHEAVPPSYGPDGMPGRIGAGGLRRSPMPMTPASGTQAPSELLPVAAVIASPPGRRDECREHGSARRAGSGHRPASRHEWRCTAGTGSRRYRHRPR